ncbi:MAG: hypothetical protein WKF57_06260 [Nakamurella sp.]
MKTSISVPDPLWNSALDASTSTSPSGIVQEALELLVESKATSGYRGVPDLPADLAQELENTRARHTEEVRSEYALGYCDGVELVTKLTWRQISYLADPSMGVLAAGRALTRLLSDQDQKKASEDWKPVISEDVLVEYLGEYADWRGIVPWHPSPERVEGIDAAVRGHYAAVKAGR